MNREMLVKLGHSSNSEYLSLEGVAKAIPAVDGRQPHLASVWRWCRKGLKARNGDRIHLRHTRIGRRVVVPVEAVAEFLDAVSVADAAYFADAAAPPISLESIPKASPALRRKQIEAAEAVCSKHGMKRAV